MANHPFPSYNHPFYPDGGHLQTFVDYGSVSTLNVDINSNGRLATTSRHRHYEKESKLGRLVGAHLSLPLFPPCKVVLNDNVFPNQRNRGVFLNRTVFKNSLVEQAVDFCRENSDVAYQSSIGLIEEQFHCKPWDLNCLCHAEIPELKPPMSKRKRLNYNAALERFCEIFVSIPLKKHIGVMKNHVYTLPNGLSEAMIDIPPKLLYDLLSESTEQQKEEMLYFDVLQGNTLAYCNMDHQSAGDFMVFYPSPSFEVLNINVVRLENTEDLSAETKTLYRKPVLLASSKNVEVNGPIRQISAVSYDYADNFVATRSRYNCSFFSTTTGTEDNSTKITIKAIDSIDNDDQVLSLAISPFIPGEGIVAMETGQVYLWHHSKKVETREVPSVAPDENWPWYQCIFAAHPRCILIANSVAADIMDLRASGSSRNLFSITSKQVSPVERISAIQRNPKNTHHYVIATDQSLMIMDDRFVQHPVLKWRHHLQDAVQHIEVMTNAIPDCNGTVVMVSGSEHRETHCFQYNGGEYEVRYTFPFSGDSIMNPPVSTVLPWKVSSYDEWPSLVPTSVLPISSVLDDRLASRLVGLCGIPMTFQQDRKGMMVLQMSSSGDIFYQSFLPDHSGKGRSNVEMRNDSKNISGDDMTFLKDWISELVKFDDEDTEWPPKSNIIETDCGYLFSKMIDLKEPHQACVLCVNDATNRTVNEQDELQVDYDEETVCQRCGVGVEFGRQLKKCRVLDLKLCKEMKSEVECGDLKLVTGADSYQDPLSKNLLKNWMSETPIPISFTITD